MIPIDDAINGYLNDKQDERQNDRKTLKVIKKNKDDYKNNEIKSLTLKKMVKCIVRLKEHDSLVISNNKWKWFSKNVGGGN